LYPYELIRLSFHNVEDEIRAGLHPTNLVTFRS